MNLKSSHHRHVPCISNRKPSRKVSRGSHLRCRIRPYFRLLDTQEPGGNNGYLCFGSKVRGPGEPACSCGSDVFFSQFEVTVSASDYFEAPEKVSIFKHSIVASMGNGKGNGVPRSFHPTEPGTYLCSIALISEFDVRAFSFVGEAVPETKNLQLEMITVSGKEVVQELPFANPSEEIWWFKVVIDGDQVLKLKSHLWRNPSQYTG